MIFEIDRASQFWGDNKQPHPKAYMDKENKCWLIEINTIEELVNLDSEGVIVNPESEYSQFPRITIYDDYIE